MSWLTSSAGRHRAVLLIFVVHGCFLTALETPSALGQESPEGAPTAPSEAVEEEAEGAAGSEGLRFSFQFAPWKDVLNWFAREADLSLVLDAPPPGTFNYTDGRAFSANEAIDLLNSVLLTKGYTLVRRERMVMLINLEDGIPPNLVSRVSPEELDQRGEYELVSCLFQFERMTPEEADEEITKLVGPQGSIVVLPRARQVLVTETAGKLRTIRAMIQAIENPTESGAQSISQLPLEHISPEEAITIVRQIMGIEEEEFATEDGSLRLSMDLVGNRLLAKATPDALAELRDIVKLIDVAVEANPAAGGIAATAQIEIYSISNADPESALQVMQTLLAGMPDVRLSIDPKTNNLIALARPAQHKTIRATLDQMQQEFSRIEVITLHKLDPETAKLAVQSLFGMGDGDEDNAKGPRVDVNTALSQLLVRGTSAELERIRQLLESMGETGEPADGMMGESGRGNVRMLPISGAMARTILDRAEVIWPSIRPNRVRTVTPSAVIPTLRSNGEEFRPPGAAGSQEDFPLRPRINRPGFDRPDDGFLNRDGSRPAVPNDVPSLRPDPRTGKAASVDVIQSAEVQGRPAYDDIIHLTRTPTIHLAQLDTSAAASDAADEQTSAPTEAKPSAVTADAPTETEAAPDIIVAPGPGGIMIASEDTAALDAFEELVQMLSDPALNTANDYTVYYLKYARAEVAESLLRNLIGSGGGTSALGTLADGALGGFGGLLGGLGEPGSFTTSGPVKIVADARLNALVVRADPADVELATQLLKIIDQQYSPENVQTTAPPRMIPVFNASAEDVAKVVKEVYANRLKTQATGGANARGGRPNIEAMMNAIRGGGGGRRGGGDDAGRGGGAQVAAEPDMTIGVDTRSNSLIVAAPDPLFEEIKTLVAQLDEVAVESNAVTRVVTVTRASPESIQKALSSIFGGQVSTSVASSSGGTRTSGGGTRTDSEAARRQADEQVRDQIRRRFEFFNAMQRGGGGRGGGGRGGGGGDRGGRGR